MITNIIKNIIKDYPSIANSRVVLVYQDKDKGEFVVTSEKNEVDIVVHSTNKRATSVEEWKKQMIADHIFMATSKDTFYIDPKTDKKHFITFAEVSDTIDSIIDRTSIIWEL